MKCGIGEQFQSKSIIYKRRVRVIVFERNRIPNSVVIVWSDAVTVFDAFVIPAKFEIIIFYFFR